ncbi:MAG: Gfo/Idh/MocA family oxidoreductase, partial [Acidimicrobiia bacterium]|nr:Gfo/Idh/MocA family oxidoreductase [Acidimicrobiia bacterium]
MQLGVIGMGRIGRSHAAVLDANPAVDRVLVASRSRASADKAAADLGLEAVDLESLVDSVDAVVIASSTDSHPELIERAIVAGKPTFCEKPIALDIEPTERIVALVDTEGGRLQIGFHRRFDPGYAAARQLVISGGLGTPYVVRTISHDPVPSPESFIPTSGGIFRDFLIHDFDIVDHVLGEPITAVFATAAVREHRVYAKYDDYDVAAVQARTASGALVTMSCTRHDPRGHDVRMELFGSRDSVVVGWDDRTPMRSLEPDGRRLPADPYEDFLDRFRAG